MLQVALTFTQRDLACDLCGYHHHSFVSVFYLLQKHPLDITCLKLTIFLAYAALSISHSFNHTNECNNLTLATFTLLS